MTKLDRKKARHATADPGAVTTLTDYEKAPPEKEIVLSDSRRTPAQTKALLARSDALWRKAVAKKRAQSRSQVAVKPIKK